MFGMEESEFIARALRDYLRMEVDNKSIQSIDWDLFAGEPLAALFSGLGIAREHNIALPAIFSEKIQALNGLSENEQTFVSEQLNSLPTFFQKAS
jgi:hypothetical protein